MVSGNHGQLLQECGVGWVFLAPILLICHIAHLKGFFPPDSQMSAVSPSQNI